MKQAIFLVIHLENCHLSWIELTLKIPIGLFDEH